MGVVQDAHNHPVEKAFKSKLKASWNQSIAWTWSQWEYEIYFKSRLGCNLKKKEFILLSFQAKRLGKLVGEIFVASKKKGP